MSFFKHTRINLSLIFTLAFCIVGSFQPSCAAESHPQSLSQNELEFIDIDGQRNETDSIFKGIKDLDQNILQEAIPLDINSVPIFENLKLFVYENYNVYWLQVGVSGAFITHRIVTDPGFFACFLPNIVPYAIAFGVGCGICYFSDIRNEEWDRRQHRERMITLKSFKATFARGAQEFMSEGQSPEECMKIRAICEKFASDHE